MPRKTQARKSFIFTVTIFYLFETLIDQRAKFIVDPEKNPPLFLEALGTEMVEKFENLKWGKIHNFSNVIM